MFRWTTPIRRGNNVPPRPEPSCTLLLASDSSGWTVRGDILYCDGQVASAGEHRAEFADGVLVIVCGDGGVITDWLMEPLPGGEV